MLIILALLLSTDISIDNMFHLHNEIRVKHGKTIVGLDQKLCKVAQDYAELLDRTDQFKHNVGGSVGDRLERAGIKFSSYGENLAKAGSLYMEDDVMKMWMRSPGHRRNILGNYEQIGIGKSGFIYVVVFIK